MVSVFTVFSFQHGNLWDKSGKGLTDWNLGLGQTCVAYTKYLLDHVLFKVLLASIDAFVTFLSGIQLEAASRQVRRTTDQKWSGVWDSGY